MFKKKPNIKTLSPLRSSDRRKTADRIISDFQLKPEAAPQTTHAENGETGDGEAEAKAAATAAHTALRNSLLPENSLSARFSTTRGPQLTEVTGTVYVGGHESGDQRVLWVSVDNRLYPSVYTLWKNPGILPLLHTPSIVVQKIKGGADLMTPGLAGPPFPPRAKKDAIVAVASLDNPSVPVAVGTCVIDVSALQKTQGVKGAAIESFHWAGDELWDWSTSGKSGKAPPESLEGWIQEDEDEMIDRTAAVSLEDKEDEDGGVSLVGEQAPDATVKGRNGYVEGEDAVAEVVDTPGEPDMTTKDIDNAFRNAFLYGVHHYKTTNPSQSKYGIEFPLGQSAVMSSLVLPFLPTFTPKQIESLVIKKTSWKKAHKFIKSLDKDKLLLAKERPPNEVDVWDIDFDDPAITGFQPYPLPKKEPADSRKGTAGGAGVSSNPTDSADPSLGQKLKILDLYRPKPALSPLLDAANAGSKSVYTKSEIRQVAIAYIDAEDLVSPKNKRLVTLNPVLSNALFDPNSSGSNSRLDAEILAQGTLPRDALIDRVLAQCSPYHVLLRNDEEFDPSSSSSNGQGAGAAAKAKAGHAPKVSIVLETRSGNKTATRVYGLEAFFVRPASLAEELRRACASSTSVEALKGGKPGTLEVMVQGPQKDAMLKALERRGVRKEWVEVTDKTKGKKKG